VDVFLNEELFPEDVVCRLGDALPPGVRPLTAASIPRAWPSLQSQLAAARYEVEVETAEDDAAFAARLAAFLSRSEAWRERRRGKDLNRYDLRPLVQELTYTGPCPLGQSFAVTMCSESGATGRPDELLAELEHGEAPRRIARLALEFKTL